MERLGWTVRKAPVAFESSAVLITTARKLAKTVRECLGGEMDVASRPGRREVPREQIVCKAMDFVNQSSGEYLSLQGLASAAGVSQRTLRTAFHEYFGTGPAQFLKLRALYQARQALRGSDPSKTTVAEVATRFGIWEFGRFARDYRSLFGELPSETLRHLH